MANQTLFTIDPEDLENQGPDRAIQIFRRLLWIESDRVGIGRNLNEVPGHINIYSQPPVEKNYILEKV